MPPPLRPGRLLVGADRGTVEADLPEVRSPRVAQMGKGALPHPRPRPADVQLRRSGAVPPTHHGPSSGGTARHFAPLRWRQITASTVRRSSGNGRPAPDRAAASAAFSRVHSASLRTRTADQRRPRQQVV